VASGGSARDTGAVTRLAFGFLVIGTLMLSFVAYQLWGTALYEHHAQDRLRSQFAGHLTHLGADSPAVSGSKGSSSTGGGDTPTVNAGGALLTSTAAAAAAAHAPAEGSPLALLTIPRLGMTNEAVVEGVNEADLQEGPGHYPGTALPGQAGNVGIAGHRTTYGAPFYNLDELQTGDPIVLQVAQGTFRYSVTRTLVVKPTDTSVLAPSPLPILTLTTCNPRYSASTRLVVTAILQIAQGTTQPGSAAVASADPPASSSTSSPAAGKPAHTVASTSATSTSLVSDGSSRGTASEAFLWAELALLAFFFVRLCWRLATRRTKWGILTVGAPLVVAAIFVFFEHVSLALPASF
jgi:sortase A